MFIGEEGERLQQKRDEQRRQYAEELKKQIAEKEKSRIPDNSNETLRRNVVINPSAPSYPSNVGNPSNTIRPPIAQPSVPGGRNLPNSYRVNSPRMSEPLPDLPPSPSPDAIRFADRLAWLESSVDQQQAILKVASDSASRIERTAIPSLSDGYQQLKMALERISTVDLPSRTRPLEEENHHLEERISSATSDYLNVIQSIRDRMNETVSVFTSTQSKFTEFSETVKATLLEYKGEVSRSRDFHDAITQRIAQNESKAAQIEEILRSVSINLNQFEKSSQDSINSTQSQINTAVSSSSLQIAQDIKQETDTRNQASSLMHSQTEEVNQRLGSSVGNVQSVINDMSLSFRQSLAALSNSVRDALEDTRNSSDQKYSELSERLDALLSDTDKNFSTVQNEAIATLGALNEHSVKAREGLESLLIQECDTRRRNEKQIASKYESFMTLIVNEMQLQTAQMEELSNSSAAHIVQTVNDAIIPLKTEANTIRERTKSLDGIIVTANRTEQLINQLNAQLMESVGTIGRQSSAIVASISKIRSELDDVVDHYSERLKIIEDEDSKPQFATKNETQEAFQRLGNDFEGRIQDIEQQIGVIFSNLSDLTMSLPAPSNTREPGSQILESLTKE